MVVLAYVSVCLCMCLSVCLLVTFVSPAKAAEPIGMPFRGPTHVGQKKSNGRVNFGVVRPILKHWQSLLRCLQQRAIQSSITAEHTIWPFVETFGTLAIIIYTEVSRPI